MLHHLHRTTVRCHNKLCGGNYTDVNPPPHLWNKTINNFIISVYTKVHTAVKRSGTAPTIDLFIWMGEFIRLDKK